MRYAQFKCWWLCFSRFGLFVAKQFWSSGFVGLKFDFGGWTDYFEFWSANPSKCLGVCYISVFNQRLISNCIYNKINIIAANISIIWESLKTSNQLAKFLRHIAGHLTTLLKFFFQNGLYFFQGTVTSIPPSGCLEVESRCYKCRRIYVCFQNFSTYYIIY